MEGSAVSDPVPALQELEITSVAETGPGPTERTAIDGSGGGHGTEASFPRSMTHDKQVHILKENWKRVLTWIDVQTYFDDKFETNPWFARVVTKLQLDCCLDGCDELEINESLIGGLISGFRMTSLDVAILMGDLKMVQKILETSSIPDELMCGSLVDLERASKGFFVCFAPKKSNFLFTPLHLAVVGGNIDIVNVLLERGADVNAPNWQGQTPLDLACKLENADMLLRLLEKDGEGKAPLHVALQHGDIVFIRSIPFLNANALDHKKRTPLHYVAACPHYNRDVMTECLKFLVQNLALDMRALDCHGVSAFYLAILYCNTQFVIAFLDSFIDEIHVNEACVTYLGPPIQIAFEGGYEFREIHRILMKCNEVKDYIESLYKQRQVSIDAGNAILVGAALIASVTFASWLQPPLNYTSYFGEGYSSSIPTPSTSDLNYVDVEHNIPLRAFWIFNALSFYFAIAAVVSGARSVVPRSHSFIFSTVVKLHGNIFFTYILLVFSVLFVIIAFAIAGTIVLTPLLKYQWCMIVPTIVGGMVCILTIVFLVKSMKEIFSDVNEGKENQLMFFRNSGYRTH